jgi:molecular chaperone GrpE
MVYKTNGRTIKIPVRRITPQLPTLENESRLLLSDRGHSNLEINEVKPEVEDRTQVETQVETHKVRAAEIRGVESQDQVRRRYDRWAKAQIREERQRLLTRLLMVADNLERALAHTDQYDPLREGVQLTLDDLMRQLAQESVEPIEALGQRFDPTLHEAVATDGSDGDVVIDVVETGYTLNGGLLRPARVIVGTPQA